MLLTPHTLVGIAIASSVPNPAVAVPISFGMHFIGDLVPHWDFFTNTTKEQRLNGWRPIAVMADLVLGVGVGLFFTLYALWVAKDSSLALNIFLCGIASVLPDALMAPSIFSSDDKMKFSIIHKLQSQLQHPADLPWGLISQFTVMIFCLLMISNSIAL